MYVLTSPSMQSVSFVSNSFAIESRTTAACVPISPSTSKKRLRTFAQFAKSPSDKCLKKVSLMMAKRALICYKKINKNKFAQDWLALFQY